MKHRQKKVRSARSILFRFELFVLIPLLLVIIAFGIYGNRIYQDRILSDTQTSIRSFLNEQQNKLSNIEYTLSNIVANDYSFQHLAYVNNTTKAYDDVYSVKEKFHAIMDNVKIIDGLGVYAANQTPYYYAVYQQGIDWREHNAVRNYITEKLGTDPASDNGKWHLQKLDGEWYLINIFGYNHVYCFCVIRPGSLSSVEQTDGKPSYLMLAGDQDLFAFPQAIQECGIQLDSTENSYITGERYFVVQEPFERIGCRIIRAIPYQGILNWRSGFLIAIPMLLIFGSILIIGQRYLRKNIVTEAENMIQLVAEAREASMTVHNTAETDNTADPSEQLQSGSNIGLQEYQVVERAVNEMVDQITALKTHAYEQEAETNRIQLQYYEIQIRPHFFLNCLANLYGLSVSGDTESMQEFILALSDYLRSVFRNHESIIPLSSELTSVRYYLKLQSMISANAPVFTEDIEESLSDYQVPPMSILTFVENSVRYLQESTEQPEIIIRIRRLTAESDSVVNISIMDNGMGFDPKVLERLNSGEGWNKEEHIGIYNIEQRFRLLYGDRCTFLFSNRGGACVDIYISEVNNESSGSR